MWSDADLNLPTASNVMSRNFSYFGCSSKLRLGFLIATLASIFAFYYLFIAVRTVPLELIHYQNLLKEFSTKDNTCNVPRLDPWDPSILKYYSEPGPLKCKEVQPEVVRLENGVLKISEDYKFSATCQYRSFRHYSGVSDSDLFYGNWTEIDPKAGRKVEKDEFMEVECTRKGLIPVTFYKYHFHQIVPVKKSIEASSVDHPSVLMFGLDGLSHSNMIRQLPLTHTLMQKMGFVDFNGHVKVADNTYPNWVAILTGKQGTKMTDFANELPDDLHMFYDDFPMIWSNFSDAGYATFFAEDRPDMGTFNYEGCCGFKFRPTDHYFRPFWMASYWTMVSSRSSPFCYNAEPKHMTQLRYLQEFIDKYQGKRTFALQWSQDMSHDYLNLIGSADMDYKAFFKANEAKWDDTIVIFFSDHGQRYDKIRETLVGRLESRLPYLSIRIPPKLKEKYPHLQENLMKNAERFTTHYDTHATLAQIATGNFTEASLPSTPQRAYSFFQPHPAKRTCQEARIPKDYCPCYNELELKAEDAVEPAHHLLSFINNRLSRAETLLNFKCLQLSLNSITASTVELPPDQLIKDRHVDGVVSAGLTISYHISLQAQPPSNAVLEGTVVKDLETGEWKVTGEIERNNKYGNTSHCVSDRSLKKMCHCI
ncbi:hypothetical protein L596_021575 [Steinernema carpocapsae]|uniref:Uncharacterized protein n=1 Tax=Steinernema carpocapsae TaxID=34508 RepID=A0A4U5MJ53_STECR|nr:hypothetical protein L596_021575 [Steinernema carpocapsae]